MLSVQKQSVRIWTTQSSQLYEGYKPVELKWYAIKLNPEGAAHHKNKLLTDMRNAFEKMVLSTEVQFGLLSPLTVYHLFGRLKAFSIWLTHQNIWAFNQVKESHLILFLKERSKLSSKGQLCKKTIANYLRMFSLLFEFRHEYRRPLKQDPSKILELHQIARNTRQEARWRPIEENQATALIHSSINWTQELAPLLLNLLNQFSAPFETSWVGKSSRQLKRIRACTYQALASTEEFSIIKKQTSMGNDAPPLVLRKAVRLLQGACLTTILFLTGMRIAEVGALKIGAVTKIKHGDGYEYTYLKSIAAKAHDTERLWIISEPVELAISYLEKLLHLTKRANHNSFLFSTFNGRGGIPKFRTKIHRYSHSGLVSLLREFISKAAPNIVAEEIHPHRARKTFARFVAIRDKRSLGALAQHFGHQGLWVTDHFYIGSDIDLEELVSEESRKDLAESLADLITSKHIAGNAAKDIQQFLVKTRKEVNFRGKHVTEWIVNDLIESGVVLAPCDWGYCLYSKETSACKGNAESPDLIQKCPTMCKSCANFCVTERHRNWWEGRYKQDEEFSKRDNLTEQTRIIITQRLAETKKVLQALNKKRIITAVELEKQYG